MEKSSSPKFFDEKSSFWFFEAKEAVEVIEATEVVEAVEVIEAAEVPDGREIIQ